ARSSSGYLFPKFFFSITQYPYFWVSAKQGAVHIVQPVKSSFDATKLAANDCSEPRAAILSSLTVPILTGH
ncbi:hypothetical protein, partial [Sulfitobacter mediterraneus]|uniref:hypothetical protein n=1 Tax=Sulfitobacter mediterraneus TaxID=83219 RepID=UPI001B85FFC7